MNHLLLVFILLLNSCLIFDDIGPHGQNGRAFVAIDYHFSSPYTYWDDNPSIPRAPHFGHFYPSHPGVYEFEYFVNPFDYWYGTYTVYTVAGSPGGAYGEPGADGPDTYLTLFCDPNGWHEEVFEQGYQDVRRAGDELSMTWEQSGLKMEIKMKKTDRLKRPTSKEPKFRTE